MREEILVIENGSVTKDQNIIFRELYLQIFKREIFGIVFDNILEKKYLIDIIKGKKTLDSGRIYFDNKKMSLKESPRYFETSIAVIEKSSKLICSLSIIENILLFERSMCKYMISHKKYEYFMKELKQLLQIDFSMDGLVSNLTPKERVIIELIKSYVEGKKLVVLVDITGFLKTTELVDILPLINRLRELDMTFVIIESFENIIFEWIDRLAFIKTGRTMGYYKADNIKLQQIYSAFIKKKQNKKIKKSIFQGEEGVDQVDPILEFNNITTEVLKNFRLSIDKGELIKIYYMDDESCDHIVELLKGLRKPISGNMILSNKEYKVDDFHQAVNKGICFIEETPYENMLFYDMSILDNVSLTLSKKVSLFWLKKRYEKSVLQFISQLFDDDISKKKLSQLSPIKLQQIAYIKWLLYAPSVVVCIKPFTEVDIYLQEVTVNMIEMLRDRGIAVIIFTPNISETYRIGGETVYIRNGQIIDEDEVYQIIYRER